MKKPKLPIVNVPEDEATPLDDGLPAITVRPPEDTVLNQALEALASQGRLFQRGHQLVHVSAPPPNASQKEPPGPSIITATSAWMRLELSRSAAFYKQTEEVKGYSKLYGFILLLKGCFL